MTSASSERSKLPSRGHHTRWVGCFIKEDGSSSTLGLSWRHRQPARGKEGAWTFLIATPGWGVLPCRSEAAAVRRPGQTMAVGLVRGKWQ